MPSPMGLGTRVQFPPPPLKAHLREIASGLFCWLCGESTVSIKVLGGRDLGRGPEAASPATSDTLAGRPPSRSDRPRAPDAAPPSTATTPSPCPSGRRTPRDPPGAIECRPRRLTRPRRGAAARAKPPADPAAGPRARLQARAGLLAGRGIGQGRRGSAHPRGPPGTSTAEVEGVAPGSDAAGRASRRGVIWRGLGPGAASLARRAGWWSGCSRRWRDAVGAGGAWRPIYRCSNWSRTRSTLFALSPVADHAETERKHRRARAGGSSWHALRRPRSRRDPVSSGVASM